MSGDLVLLTGATGFVGYRTLVAALEAGYRVRCAIRNQSGIDKVLAAPSIKNLKPSDEQLSWAIVTDITVPGAYDEAVRGVKYIIHCASPVPKFGSDDRQGTDEEIYVNPAVAGAVGMLESAAARAPSSVKRVVVTSSIMAIIPIECFMGEELDRPGFTGESRVATPAAPYGSSFEAYTASKVASLNACEAWMQKHRPAFDLVPVIPAWVWGHDELSTRSEALLGGSNSVLLEFLMGRKSETPINNSFISVDDVADAHIRALSSGVSGGQGFLLSATFSTCDLKMFARKQFPEAFTGGIFNNDGAQPTLSIPIDASEGEELLGRKYVDGEEIVRRVAGQFLRLVERSK